MNTGNQFKNKILEGYNAKRKTTLRVNEIISNSKNVQDVLKENGIKYQTVEWYKSALILSEDMEKRIEQLDIYKNGEIYLQSLSSMMPPIILNPKPKENILDMCSAPGSKTTQMAVISGNQAYITACERNSARAERLKYNIEKQGCKGIFVMIRDARDLDDMFSFDKILLDAPCSGSGTIFAYDNNIDKYFTEELIKKSTKTQVALLKKALKLLKPGGELVYSTCSILKEENEEIIKQAIAGANMEIVPIELDDNIPLLPVTVEGTVCIMPNKLYEGFFVAKIQKRRNLNGR